MPKGGARKGAGRKPKGERPLVKKQIAIDERVKGWSVRKTQEERF